MTRLSDIPESLAQHLVEIECPRYDKDPWVTGPPLAQRRVAIISTAGLQKRGDRPFDLGANDYRIIEGDLPSADLVMSHISTNFDRTGFQQDINVVFPIDRLRELVAEGAIGSVAAFHYSFMGATAPEAFEGTVKGLAPLLKRDGVDAVLLAPV